MATQKITQNQIVQTADPDWTDLGTTYLNSWVYYGAPYYHAGYYKDSDGFVHLRGMVKSGTPSSTSYIFNLPAGYRPSSQCLFMTISNATVARCDVKTDGNVIAYTGSGSWFSIDGLIFKAEA